MSKKQQKKKNFLFQFISPKRYIVFIVGLAVALSLFFSIFKFDQVPPCVNADEAAFGYNAYSILKTGADEYGTLLPVRLKSFGDYKMPLYSYLSIPFVGVFGLNDLGIRGLNIFLAIIFPIIIYFLAKELFEKDEIGAISSLLISSSLGFGIVDRHAHEAFLASVLISLSILFLIRFIKYVLARDGLLFAISLFFSLFAYQSSRVFALYLLICLLLYVFYKKKITTVKSVVGIILVVLLLIFAITDVIYKPERIKNLLLTNTAGFTQSINQLRAEGGSGITYNKATLAIRDVINNELPYFSPQFLVVDGDQNKRFGFPSMSPMTIVDYLAIFVGIYYLFKNRERWRYFLLGLLIITPLTAAFSWAETSLTRTLFLLVPLLIIAAYGMYNVLLFFAQKKKLFYVLPVLIILEIVFLFYSWDFYFNHYAKRPIITRAWQCGYKELGDYVKSNYNKYNTFYITKKNGEPYIFLLYYLQYPPQKYQKHASLTSADEFGFGQVEGFDKFKFSFPPNAIHTPHVVLIGYPDDFSQIPALDTKRIKKIIINNEEIFWIYET